MSYGKEKPHFHLLPFSNKNKFQNPSNPYIPFHAFTYLNPLFPLHPPPFPLYFTPIYLLTTHFLPIENLSTIKNPKNAIHTQLARLQLQDRIPENNNAFVTNNGPFAHVNNYKKDHKAYEKVSISLEIYGFYYFV